MSLIFKNDAGSLPMRVTMGLCFKNYDTPVNGRPSLFRIDSVHKMDMSIIYVHNLLSRATPCFGKHVRPLVPVAFAIVSTHSSFKEG
jgi:hypothetical protein